MVLLMMEKEEVQAEDDWWKARDFVDVHNGKRYKTLFSSRIHRLRRIYVLDQEEICQA